MKHLFEKINWKRVNLSAWFMILLAYIMPFYKVEEFEIQIGYPVPFLFIHNMQNTALQWNPLATVGVNLGSVFFNLVFLYFILYGMETLRNKIKK